jgi:hypothetical protein
MEKLFAALQEQHPGFDVVDVRFLANQPEVNGRQALEMDEDFAKAVREATPLDIGSLAG